MVNEIENVQSMGADIAESVVEANRRKFWVDPYRKNAYKELGAEVVALMERGGGCRTPYLCRRTWWRVCRSRLMGALLILFSFGEQQAWVLFVFCCTLELLWTHANNELSHDTDILPSNVSMYVHL